MNEFITYQSYKPTNILNLISICDLEMQEVDGTTFCFDLCGNLRVIYSSYPDSRGTSYILVLIYKKEIEYVISGTLYETSEFLEDIYRFEMGSLVGYQERSNVFPFDLRNQEEDEDFLSSYLESLKEELDLVPGCLFSVDEMSSSLSVKIAF
jgi:hypothetical protein